MRATTNHKHITPTTKTHLGQRDPANNPNNRGQPATPEHPKQSYGGHSDRETPGPIPNPEAKPASADDTTQPGWKSRTPPNTTQALCPPILLGGKGISIDADTFRQRHNL